MFSDFGRVSYVTKTENIRNQMKDKMYKAIMVGYADNHIRYTYKFYNPETKRFIMTRDSKWVDRKMTDPAETMKMFRDSHKEDLVLRIE